MKNTWYLLLGMVPVLAGGNLAAENKSTEAPAVVEPVLLQGEAKPGATSGEVPWYRSNNPEALRERIRALEEELVRSRKASRRPAGSSDKERKTEAKQAARIISEHEKTIKALRQDVESGKKEAAAMEELSGTLKKRAQELSEELKSMRVRESEADAEAQNKLREARAREEKLVGEIRDLEGKLKDASEAKPSPGNLRLEKNLAKTRAQVEALSKENERLQEMVTSLVRARNESEVQAAQLKEQLEDLREAQQNAPAPEEPPGEMPKVPVEELEEKLEAPAEPGKMEKTGKVAGPAGEPEPAALEQLNTPAEDTPARMISEGHRQLRQGKVNEAADLFTKAARLDQTRVEAQLGLAACYYSTLQLEEAKKIVDEVLKNDAAHPTALGLQGIMLWREGRTSAEEDQFESAREQFNRAESVLARAIEQNARDALLFNYSGIVANELNKEEAAIEAFKNAVRLDPEHAEAHFNLAVMLARNSNPRPEEARQHYEKALTLGTQRDEDLETILYP